MATEIAYYTYIYAKVEKVHFQKVTSHTRAALLAGRTLSGVLAQLLVSFNLMDYRQLNYITFTGKVYEYIYSYSGITRYFTRICKHYALYTN